MTYERIVHVKRTVWVSECVCGNRDVRTENPPRERQCPDCKEWVGYKKETYTGPDLA